MKNKNIKRLLTTIVVFIFSFYLIGTYFDIFPDFIFKINKKEPPKALAVYQYTPTGGQLVTGNEVATGQSNTGSWKGLFYNDSNYWSTTRVNPGGLNKQIYFDGVELYGANKMIITIEDKNVTTADAYVHQICDWVSSTGVDSPADAYCTGGGWRNLNPRKLSYTNTADTTRVYEIYNGYFDTRASSPGTPINTPLTNFIEPTNKRVLIRIYSTVNSTTQHDMDLVQLEVAIDPIYESAEFVKDSGGTTTNFYSDLIGAVSTNVNASDNVKLSIPMPAASQPVDVTFKFKNIKTYQGMNTILVLPEICVSDTALTFGIYARNFTNSTWTQLGSNITGTACTTDTEYALAFNSATISGFNLSDYISSTGEIWIRFYTNAPTTAYNIQFDRIYLMLGSVNADSSQCEISWGTGTASNCIYTRDVNEAKTGTPATLTWQTTSVLEYPSSFYSYDNDDDTTDGEAAFSSNLSFPITPSSNMAITAIHYAAKFRSNDTAITVQMGLRDYSGLTATGGWLGVVATNAATTYSWIDSWVYPEVQTNPEDYVDTVNNRMNARLRTSASTATAAGTVRDWDFAMMSVRWAEKVPPPVISVSVSDGAINYGIIPAGTSKGTLDLNDTQTVVNDGNVGENFNIKGQNTSCWTLAETAGSEQYVHQYCVGGLFCDSPPSNYIPLTTSYQTFYTNVPVGGSTALDFLITVPTATNCYTQQSADVTIQAVQY